MQEIFIVVYEVYYESSTNIAVETTEEGAIKKAKEFLDNQSYIFRYETKTIKLSHFQIDHVWESSNFEVHIEKWTTDAKTYYDEISDTIDDIKKHNPDKAIITSVQTKILRHEASFLSHKDFKQFFESLEIGEVFVYRSSWDPQNIKQKIRDLDIDVEVEYCLQHSEEYKKHGCYTMKRSCPHENTESQAHPGRPAICKDCGEEL